MEGLLNDENEEKTKEQFVTVSVNVCGINTDKAMQYACCVTDSKPKLWVYIFQTF